MALDRAAIKARQRESLADAEAKAEARSGAGYMKIRECKSASDRGNVIRLIMPPGWNPNTHDPYLATQKYSLPMEGFQYGKDFYSPTFYGLPDPVNEERERLLQDGKKDEAKELAPRDEYLALVVDVETDETIAKGPQVWKFGAKAHKALLQVLCNDEYFTETEGPVWDTEVGFDLYVRRTGTGFDTEYGVTPKRNSSPLPNAKEIMLKAAEIDLLRFVTVDTEETLMDALSGEYDKKIAKQRRDERDKALGNPVHELFHGGEQPNPTAAASKPKNSKDSAQSTAGPKAGGTTRKAATAKSAEKTGDSGTATKTPTEQTPTPPMTDTSGTAEATTEMTSPSEDLQANVGKRVTFTDAGKQMEAEVIGVEDGQYVVKMPDGEEWNLPPDMATVLEPEAAQPTTEETPGTMTPTQRKSYGDRIAQHANE